MLAEIGFKDSRANKRKTVEATLAVSSVMQPVREYPIEITMFSELEDKQVYQRLSFTPKEADRLGRQLIKHYDEYVKRMEEKKKEGSQI